MKILLHAVIVSFTITAALTLTTPLLQGYTMPHKASAQSYHEISITHDKDVLDTFKNLTPQERCVAYYLYRASIPCNAILTDQHHRHAPQILELFERLYEHQEAVIHTLGKDFMDECSTFLVYLWTNHGHYFKREHENNKRTPSRIGLSLITPANLIQALELTGLENAQDIVRDIESSLFDTHTETTLTVTGSIEKSAINIYAPGFTKEHYDALSADSRGHINASYELDEHGKPFVRRYGMTDKYAKELETSVYWLQKAHDHALRYPQEFDDSFIQSLVYLIEFLKTGDEKFFKKHSREWLKTKSRVEYTFGFIEVYDDPLESTGSIEAEVTLKKYDLTVLSSLLPKLEQAMPLPTAQKRAPGSPLPNASINEQLFGAGDFGPLKSVLAYCLPNYNEIRSNDGSKQIMYPAGPSLAEKIDPEKAHRLMLFPDQVAWFELNDPTYQLLLDIENIHTILHETIGHASGRLTEHTFREGDNLTIQNTTYNVGDTIKVTSENTAEFLIGYDGALEELRAEIIALYISINFIEDLATHGFLKNWASKLSTDDLITWHILVMASKGLRRLVQQADDATCITGHHAQANTTIMYYLLDNGGLTLSKESVVIHDEAFDVPALRITNLGKAKELIKELMQKVQEYKSTGDEQGTKGLIENYGKRFNASLAALVKHNQKALVGHLKAQTTIYPTLNPVYENEELVDVHTSWPETFFQAQTLLKQRMYSRN